MNFKNENIKIIFNIVGNQGVILFGNFLLFLLISIHYGPKLRGEYAILYSSFLLFSSIFSFGIGKTLPSFFYNRHYKNDILIKHYLLIISVLIIIAISAFYLFNKVFPNILKINPNYILSFILILPYLIWSQNNIYIFNELGILNKQVKLSITLLIFYCITLFILIYFANINFISYLIFHSVSYFLFVIADVFLLSKYIKISFESIKNELLVKFFKEGSKIYLETIVGLSNSTFYFLIMSNYLSKEIIGNFSFATQILSIITMPALIMHQYYINKNLQNSEYWSEQKLHLKYLIFFLFILISCALLTAYFLFPTLKSFGYSHFFEIFTIIIFSVLFSYFSYFMYSQWLVKGFLFKYSLNNLISMLISIPLTILMMKYFGVVGASISFSFIYIFSLPGNILFFKKLSISI